MASEQKQNNTGYYISHTAATGDISVSVPDNSSFCNSPTNNKEKTSCNNGEDEAIKNGDEKHTTGWEKALVWFTLIALIIGGIQTCLSRESIDVATDAMDSNTVSANKMFLLTQQSFNAQVANAKSSDSATKASLQIAQKNTEAAITSSKAQIDALANSQEQFKKAHQPYIQLANPSIIFAGVDVLKITYSLENVGDVPVYISSKRTNTAVGRKQLPFEIMAIDTTVGDDIANIYLNRGGSVDGTVTVRDIANEYIMIEAGKYHIYLLQRVRYENLITHQQRRYDIYLKLTFQQFSTRPNQTYFEIIYTKNYDDNSPKKQW